MRVLIAPDCFGSTLTATEAAAAMAAGWSTARPGDVITRAPQSDGGPGFVDALAACGETRETTVAGPLGDPVRARWRLTRIHTAYIEVAQACGLHLLPGAPTPQSALAATSLGVGQLIAAALEAGATALVIGLGGTACTDGGAGMVQALGGVEAFRAVLAGIEVLAATDVRNPLLGPEGAAAVFGPQKGADEEMVRLLEARLEEWAAELGGGVAEREGTGAAGGLGAALLAAGARVRSGSEVLGELTGRRAAIGTSDLVLTGEGRLDEQTLQGKVCARIAAEAREARVPAVVLAGQVTLDPARWPELGAESVYSLAESAGSVDAAMAHAAQALETLAALVGRRTCRE